MVGRDTLAGVWRLISYQSRLPDGTVSYPFGQDARGMIMYEPVTGCMSGQMMRVERPLPAKARQTAAAAPAGSAEELKAVLGGYLAYAGTYDVDDDACSVTHHVQCALLPEWVGIDLVRFFAIEGDRVVYRTPTVSANGGDLVSVLVWERVGSTP